VKPVVEKAQKKFASVSRPSNPQAVDAACEKQQGERRAALDTPANIRRTKSTDFPRIIQLSSSRFVPF
jgi:hypothetical protein